MPRVPDVKKEMGLSPTLIEESAGITYWLIKKINAIPMAARIKKLITAVEIFLPKSSTPFPPVCSILFPQETDYSPVLFTYF